MHTYKRKKRINGYLIVELNAQDRELIVIRVSVVLVDETYYTRFILAKERSILVITFRSKLLSSSISKYQANSHNSLYKAIYQIAKNI